MVLRQCIWEAGTTTLGVKAGLEYNDWRFPSSCKSTIQPIHKLKFIYLIYYFSVEMSRLFTRWWEWNVFHITSNNVQVFECCYHYFCEHTDILKSVLSSLFLMKPYLCCYFTEAVCLWSKSDVWPFLTLNRVWWEDSATMWGQGMMFILLHSVWREGERVIGVRRFNSSQVLPLQ